MKTQISRESHRPAENYSGVYQQQGRILTDADWNELVDIVKRQLAEALDDVIGNGSPRQHGVQIKKSADGKLQIVPGDVYADGIRGVVAAENATSPTDPFPFDKQLDFPGATPPPNNSARVYADVWERPVTAVQDGELADPGLHGADTCTRTQVLAQIKWCPSVTLPEASPKNPPNGNALLTVTLSGTIERDDPCDPCASEIELDERVGSYLFRIEVHDVKGPADAPTGITLKWSRENAAEHHRLHPAPGGASDAETAADNGEEPAPPFAHLPAEFKDGGPWIWELFDDTSERHLGVHHAEGFQARRGELLEAFPEELPTAGHFARDAGNEAPLYIRRWDGYLELDFTGGITVVAGKDRDTALDGRAGAAATDDVTIDGMSITVPLEHLTLTLNLTSKSAVAGDYWLAAVRESRDAVGDTVLRAQPPRGIVHHYVELAGIDGDGSVTPPDTDRCRQIDFPPLTDIHARDVCYHAACEGGNEIFHNFVGTVKDALDRLCDIEAKHVKFDKPCNTSVFHGVPPEQLKTVADALALLCNLRANDIGYEPNCPSGLFAEGHNTVKKALDRICEIEAQHVKFTASDECPELKDEKNVHAAIEALCRHKGEACCIPVRPQELTPGLIHSLLEQRKAACLCLLPGEHKWPRADFDGASWSLTVRGVDPKTTKLEVLQSKLSQFAHFGLENIHITGARNFEFADVAGIRVAGCRFHDDRANVAALTLAATEDIELSGNVFDLRRDDILKRLAALLEQASGLGRPFFPPLAPAEFQRQARAAANHVARRPLQHRQQIATEIHNAANRTSDVLVASEQEAFKDLAEAVQAQQRQPTLTRNIARRLVTLRNVSLEANPPIAVVVSDASARTRITDNVINGCLSLYGEPAPQLWNEAQLKVLRDRITNVGHGHNSWTFDLRTTRRDVRIERNRITKLEVGKELTETIQRQINSQKLDLENLFNHAFVSENVFESPVNQFVALGNSWTANRFDLTAGQGQDPLGIVIGVDGLYLGHYAPLESNEAKSSIYSVTKEGREAGNMVRILGLNLG